MKYSLDGDASQLAEMVAAIELTPGVQTVAFGSGPASDPDSGSDDGWS